MEYAFKAIESAGTAVGVRCKDGVLLGVEKLVLSKMLVEGSGRRVVAVAEHCGAATAGLIPDARQLVTRARDEARDYKQAYGEAAPPRILAERMGGFMHLYTVYWSTRPFGASILLAGYDAEAKSHELYLAEPTGAVFVRGGRARHGSTVIVSPSRKLRMCNWQVVTPGIGPWGMPLIVIEHMPQMPSRQSWSKAKVSLPALMSCSLSMSIISRKEAEVGTAARECSSKAPGWPRR